MLSIISAAVHADAVRRLAEDTSRKGSGARKGAAAGEAPGAVAGPKPCVPARAKARAGAGKARSRLAAKSGAAGAEEGAEKTAYARLVSRVRAQLSRIRRARALLRSYVLGLCPGPGLAPSPACRLRLPCPAQERLCVRCCFSDRRAARAGRQEETFLEAYENEGWRGGNRERVRPSAELERARLQVRPRCAWSACQWCPAWLRGSACSGDFASVK